jgi:hypothetical protein
VYGIVCQILQAFYCSLKEINRLIYLSEGIIFNHQKEMIAGWSSPVARWAHNPKVLGSNPSPATNKNPSKMQK